MDSHGCVLRVYEQCGESHFHVCVLRVLEGMWG